MRCCIFLTGAPGYIASTFLNGMSFVEGWEQNFFISKWSMHQLVGYFAFFNSMFSVFLFICYILDYDSFAN